MQGADGKLSTQRAPRRRRRRRRSSKKKGPAWLLRGIPNMMSLLIPSGKRSQICRRRAGVTQIGRGSSRGWDRPKNSTAEPQPLVLSMGTGWQTTLLRWEVVTKREERIPPVTQCQSARPQCHVLAATQPRGAAAAANTLKRRTGWL